MAQSRKRVTMSSKAQPTEPTLGFEDARPMRQGLLAVGGLLGALAASSCCIAPLALFSLGVGGAWMSNLTALAPYKPIFVALTLGLVGYGYHLVYGKPRAACAAQGPCARPLPRRSVKLGLWSATVLVPGITDCGDGV